MIGYGNSMFLATHGILARSASGGGVDPDAQAFITAAAITDPTQQSAINQLVVDLKGYSIWTKMKALYPFVGGTATTHSYNLKNTAQFQITWNGGITHNSQGVTFNGTNGYGNTGYNLSTNSTITNISAGAYNRSTGNTGAAFGAVNEGFQGTQLYIKFSNNNTYYTANDYIITGNGNYVSDRRGFFIVNRESLTSKRLYKNGASVTSDNPNGNDANPNANVLIGARGSTGATIDGYDTGNYAFHFLGDTLTATDIANFYTAVQAFQTALSRNV